MPFYLLTLQIIHRRNEYKRKTTHHGVVFYSLLRETLLI